MQQNQLVAHVFILSADCDSRHRQRLTSKHFALMRPLNLLLGYFLPFVLSDFLWGCEPNCMGHTESGPDLAERVIFNASWFMAGENKVSPAVLIADLTKKLILDSREDYGIVILESGSDFSIQWLLSTSTETLGISGLVPSKTPQGNFNQLVNGLYVIDDKFYNITVQGMVFASPSVSIYFTLLSSNQLDCSFEGLIFAIVPWSAVKSQFSREINFLTSSQCPYCSSLPLSNKIIKICPRRAVSIEETIPTSILPTTTILSTESTMVLSTETTTTKPSVTSVTPNMTENSSWTTRIFHTTKKKETMIPGSTKSTLSFLTETMDSGTATTESTTVLSEETRDILPSFVVVYPKKVIRCEKNILFMVRQLAGIGNDPPSFKWSLMEGPEVINALEAARDKRFVSLTTKMIKNNVTINLTVCNSAGGCKHSGPLTVEMLESNESLTLDIEGIPEFIYPSMSIKLEARAQFKSCLESIDARDAQFIWNVTNETFLDSIFRIPAYKYTAGVIIPLSLEATYKDPKTDKFFMAETTIEIKFSEEPLILIVDAAHRVHPSDAPLYIDASISRDPNSPNSVLRHSWSCFNLSSNVSCRLSGIDWYSDILEIGPEVLETNGNFQFVDVIKSSSGQSGNITATVKISAPMFPSLTVIPQLFERQSIYDYIRLLVLISSEEAPTNVSWQVIKEENYGFFNLKDILSDNRTDFDINSNGRKMLASLTIPPKNEENWTGLLPNTKYLIRLIAGNKYGATSADIEIVTQEELPQGEVEVEPSENLTALISDITIRFGDGWSQKSFPITYRFGYRTLFTNNESIIEWLPHSMSTSTTVVLPSGGPMIKSCRETIGYTAMIEACDRSGGSCRISESANFTVNSVKNVTLAINDVISKLNNDIVNENHLEVMQKIWVIEQELCQNFVDANVADRSTLALIHSLSSQSELEEWKEIVEATSHVLPSVSDNVLLEVLPILQRYSLKIGHSGTPNRQKRDADMITMANNNLTSESEASGMLKVCDLLLWRNQKVTDIYLANINDFLAGFCLQLDENSSRILIAKGDNYTQIQAQTVNPSRSDFSGDFKTAGGTAPIHFTAVFQSLFREWSCGSMLFCHYTCLASAKIQPSAFVVNSQLLEYFYPAGAIVNFNRSVSAIYKISIIDPTTGKPTNQMMSVIPLYSLAIPIDNYQPTNYYSCFIFTDSSISWDSHSCTTSNYATKVAGTYFISCNCSTSGYIGVYQMPPPPPPLIPLHNEVQFTFVVNSTDIPNDSQQTAFKNAMKATGQIARLVDWNFEKNNNSLVEVKVTLRPSFKDNQITNPYAVQSILRIVDPQSGFIAWDNLKILVTSYQIIQRSLIGDGNARKIIVKIIDKIYSQVVGNNSDVLALKWTNTIATTFKLSNYRFKNAEIFMGIMFNFTITKSFEEEKYPLSAEEISLMLLESTKYNEIDVIGSNGEPIKLPVLNGDKDIVELRVIQQSNPLVTILLIVISTVLLIVLLYIGGAIVVKIRTDRCIEEERRRVVMVDATNLNAPPRYGEATQNHGFVRARHR